MRESSQGGMCWGPERVCDSHMLPAISLKEFSLKIKASVTQPRVLLQRTEHSALVTEKIFIF